MITLNLNDSILKTLSAPELQILKYVYDQPQQVLEMSIQQMAKQVAYSTATVLRFCKKLGYSGFAELKYALRAELQSQQGAQDAGQQYRTVQSCINEFSADLEATAKLIHEEQLEQVFAWLDSGCPIILWSPDGLTAVAVEYFEKLLLSIGRQNVYFVEALTRVEHLLHNCPPRSLLVLVSASGKSATTLRLGKIAKLNHVAVLSITPYTSNEIAGLADISFRFFARVRENRGAEFTARLPILFIINTIVQCYLLRKDGGGTQP